MEPYITFDEFLDILDFLSHEQDLIEPMEIPEQMIHAIYHICPQKLPLLLVETEERLRKCRIKR